ncbi:protein ORF128 [Cyprinid herpesvirus 2]|uniref:Protein ORF128 n=1 Tax=Cyprinid herpesvirus 2 TaxID=317878 RepID=K7PCP4_CYHV2|nr:protein ORF128 [Cyprinid herpesvirus 2]AFJ20560.1 protein ORF128 [Cyprinid herpesvirus 2]
MDRETLLGHLSCHECGRLFRDPVTVSCGHSFCRLCVRSVCGICLIECSQPFLVDELPSNHVLCNMVCAVEEDGLMYGCCSQRITAVIPNVPPVPKPRLFAATATASTSSAAAPPVPSGAALPPPPPPPPPVPTTSEIKSPPKPMTCQLPVPYVADGFRRRNSKTNDSTRRDHPPPAPSNLVQKALERCSRSSNSSSSSGSVSASATGKKQNNQRKLKRIVSDLIFREKCHMRLLCHRYMVDAELDPTTAHSNVKVDMAGKICYYTPVKQQQQGKRSFSTVPAVMSKKGHFTAFYAEMSVENKSTWTFGVCAYNADMRMVWPCPTGSAWTVSQIRDGRVYANTNNINSNKDLVSDSILTKVGVFVDQEVGSVHFLDATSFDTLYVFKSQPVANAPIHVFVSPESSESVPVILATPAARSTTIHQDEDLDDFHHQQQRRRSSVASITLTL